MSKTKDENNVSLAEALALIFGDAKVEVKSRGEGENFSAPISDLSSAGLIQAVKAGVADILNGQSMATLTKPSKEDFATAEEFTEALKEYLSEKNIRKTAAWNGLHTGVLPVFPAKSWTSPLRQEIDRIVYADLVAFFGGQPVRGSTPKAVYALPDRKSKDYAGFAGKWLAKYQEEITAEAAKNVVDGITTTADVPQASSDLEF